MGAKKAKGKKGAYEWSGDLRRIIPLKNNYCYINDDMGKTPRLKRDSEDFYNLLFKLDEVMKGKITRELKDLGWTEELNVLTSMQTEREEK